MAVTVLLVEDVPELRSVLRQALRLHGGFDVVAEASDGTRGVAAAAEHQPDVVVLDLGLPDLAGREVVTRLQAVAPRTQIVVYTGSITEEGSDVSDRVAAFVSKDRDVGYLVSLLADLSRRPEQSASLRLRPDPEEVAEARRFLREQCVSWSCTEVLDDVLLVGSELVTNAFVHARSRCELRARLAAGILRLEVLDEGSGVPDLLRTSSRDEHGRGMVLVSSVATAWGVEAIPGSGKVVWAELPCPPGVDTADGSRSTPTAAPAAGPGTTVGVSGISGRADGQGPAPGAGGGDRSGAGDGRRAGAPCGRRRPVPGAGWPPPRREHRTPARCRRTVLGAAGRRLRLAGRRGGAVAGAR